MLFVILGEAALFQEKLPVFIFVAMLQVPKRFQLTIGVRGTCV